MARQGWVDDPAVAAAYNDSPEGRARALQERRDNVAKIVRGDYIKGTIPPDWGGSQFGETPGAYDADVNRYRGMGAGSVGRGPPTLDQTQSGESREMQMGALEMLRRHGAGLAPSAADILSDRANQNAIMTAGRQATAARSLGGRIAASSAAGQQAGQAMLAGNAANAAARAAEVSRAQVAYAGGLGAAQGQDISAATVNAQMAAKQRAMDEARQQYYERMGWNVREAQSQADMRAQRNSDAAMADLERRNLAEQANERAMNETLAGMGLGGAIGAAALLSDERTKNRVAPLLVGPLSSMRRL